MKQAELSSIRTFGPATIQVFPSPVLAGKAAAQEAARFLQSTIARCGKARLFVATGNSQLEMMNALVEHDEVDWHSIEVFHLDEYVGLPRTHPSSFRYWVKSRLDDKVHPGLMHYLEGDAADLEQEIARYSALILQKPVDLAFVGIGENGHIAFNDPSVADFDDPAVVKRVVLDDACRRQQTGEGHFDTLDAVPREALTVTCSTLLRVNTWICCIPEARKAQAVRAALEGPISPECPGSLVRRHPNSLVYLDTASASLLAGAGG